jgi:hypothetical protein
MEETMTAIIKAGESETRAVVAEPLGPGRSVRGITGAGTRMEKIITAAATADGGTAGRYLVAHNLDGQVVLFAVHWFSSLHKKLPFLAPRSRPVMSCMSRIA